MEVTRRPGFSRSVALLEAPSRRRSGPQSPEDQHRRGDYEAPVAVFHAILLPFSASAG